MSNTKISESEIEEAYSKILKYVGEDNTREGLLETPNRVRKALLEWFSGYEQDPKEILNKMFKEVNGYSQMIILKDISFESHCEHHMCPIIGTAHIAYIPKDKVVGISKLARLVDCFAKRFQIQERMTNDISSTLMQVLECKGVAVMIEAEHFCISTRGIKKKGSSMITYSLEGIFENDTIRKEFFDLVNR
jgi:GTP cyclohydrolase IA